ncbi:unnamed protein product [Ambrosiozyma monospora]|uniref:Unnamed protein product n=1 Tax=Ambrosiozyma monospora TaxID=43982 RepID=A0A9W7DHI1_AMBMO|nr:unnamed protein product [Ambrosiozyma monospora]
MSSPSLKPYIDITSSLPVEVQKLIIFQSFECVSLSIENYRSFLPALKFVKSESGYMIILTDNAFELHFVLPSFGCALIVNYPKVKEVFGDFSFLTGFKFEEFVIRDQMNTAFTIYDFDRRPMITRTSKNLIDNANKYYRMLKKFEPLTVHIRHQKLPGFDFLDKVTRIDSNHIGLVQVCKYLDNLKSLEEVRVEISTGGDDDQFSFLRDLMGNEYPDPVVDWYKVLTLSENICKKADIVKIMAEVDISTFELLKKKHGIPKSENLVFQHSFINGAIKDRDIASLIEADQVQIADIKSVENASCLRQIGRLVVDAGRNHILDNYTFKDTKVTDSLMIQNNVKNCNLHNVTGLTTFACHNSIDSNTFNSIRPETLRTVILYDKNPKGQSYKLPRYVTHLDINYSYLNVLDLTENENLEHIELTYGLHGLTKNHKIWEQLPETLESINIRYKYSELTKKDKPVLFGITLNKKIDDIEISFDTAEDFVFTVNVDPEHSNMFVKEINTGFKKKNSYYKVEIDAYNNFKIQTFSNAFIVSKNDSFDKITLMGYNDDNHKKKLVKKRDAFSLGSFGKNI